MRKLAAMAVLIGSLYNANIVSAERGLRYSPGVPASEETAVQDNKTYGYLRATIPEWQAYTKKLIENIFPDDPDANSLQVVFVEDNEPNAHANFEQNVLRITSGFLSYFENEAEYAFIMTHEVQHILNRHGPTLRATGWFSVEEDFELLRRQEITADILAAYTMQRAGIDTCGGSRVMTRLANYSNVYDDVKDPYNRIILRRKQIADYFCKKP